MTRSEGEEAREAVETYTQAVKRTSTRQNGYHTIPSTGGQPIGDSGDEGTSIAKEANDRRREEAKIEKLEAKNRRREQENELRVTIANQIIGFVAAQLVLTNMLAWLYALVMLARDETIPSEVIVAWLSSTIVEIIGLLWVVARSLFPFRDKRRNADAEKKTEVPSPTRT